MKATVEQLLLGLVVVAFGLGYLAGEQKSSSAVVVQPQAPSIPVNYDPVRAMASDAIKAAQDSEQRCWADIQALLTERAKVVQNPVGH